MKTVMSAGIRVVKIFLPFECLHSGRSSVGRDEKESRIAAAAVRRLGAHHPAARARCVDVPD